MDAIRETLAARIRELEKVLGDLVETVNATGGVIEDRAGYSPVADTDWTDLGAVYIQACAALGKPPELEVIEDSNDD